MIVGAEIVDLKSAVRVCHKHTVFLAVDGDLHKASLPQGCGGNAFIDGSRLRVGHQSKVIFLAHVLRAESEDLLKGVVHHELEILSILVVADDIRLHLCRIILEQRVGLHRIHQSINGVFQAVFKAEHILEGRPILLLHSFRYRFHLTGHQGDAHGVRRGLPLHTHMGGQLHHGQQCCRIVSHVTDNLGGNIAAAVLIVFGPQILFLLAAVYIRIAVHDGHISGITRIIIIEGSTEGFVNVIAFSFRAVQHGAQDDVLSLTCLKVHRNDVIGVIGCWEYHFTRLGVADHDLPLDLHGDRQILVTLHVDGIGGKLDARVGDAHHGVNIVFPPKPLEGRVVTQNRKAGIVGDALRHQHAVGVQIHLGAHGSGHHGVNACFVRNGGCVADIHHTRQHLFIQHTDRSCGGVVAGSHTVHGRVGHNGGGAVLIRDLIKGNDVLLVTEIDHEVESACPLVQIIDGIFIVRGQSVIRKITVGVGHACTESLLYLHDMEYLQSGRNAQKQGGIAKLEVGIQHHVKGQLGVVRPEGIFIGTEPKLPFRHLRLLFDEEAGIGGQGSFHVQHLIARRLQGHVGSVIILPCRPATGGELRQTLRGVEIAVLLGHGHRVGAVRKATDQQLSAFHDVDGNAVACGVVYLNDGAATLAVLGKDGSDIHGAVSVEGALSVTVIFRVTGVHHGGKAVHFQRRIGGDRHGQLIGQFKEFLIVIDDHIGELEGIILANRPLGDVSDLHGNAIEAIERLYFFFTVGNDIIDAEFCAKCTRNRQLFHFNSELVRCIRIHSRLNILGSHGAGVLIETIAQDVHQQVGRGCYLQGDLAVHDLGFQLAEQVTLRLQNRNADAGIILHALGQFDLHSTLLSLRQIDNNDLTVHGGLQFKFTGIVVLIIKGVCFIQGDGEAVAEGVRDHGEAIQLCTCGQYVVLQPVDVPVDLHLVGNVLVPCHDLHAKGGKDGHSLQVFVQLDELHSTIAVFYAKLGLLLEEFPIRLLCIIVAGKGDAGEGVTGLINA